MFLKILAFASWSLLRPLLDRFWTRFGFPNRTKSAPTGLRNRSQKWLQKWLHLKSIFDWFFVDFGDENGAKIDQKSITKAIKNKMRFWMDLGSLLERFWSDFGLKLGAKLGPSWDQNPSKIDVEKRWNQDGHRELWKVRILNQSGASELLKVKKNEKIRPAICVWSQLGPNLEPKTLQKCSQVCWKST